MISIRRGKWCPVLACAVAIAWFAGTAAAQSPEMSAASSPADNSDESSGEREAARRTLFKRSPGLKWETDKDPKYVPWSGLTEEPTDPAKERRRSGLLDRLSRGWTGSKSSDAASAARASATAGSAGASRSAKAEAAKSPAQSTNPAAGLRTGRIPKTATLASFTTVLDPPGVPPASASAPALLSAAPLAGGVALAAGSNAASASLGKAFSGDGQQTLPLESLPQPALPAPSIPGGEPTIFQEVATNGETPNAALRVSEQQSLPFHKRFFQGYPALVTWFPKHIPKPPEEPDEPEPARRSPPSPWDAPPFPMSEYQGYPLIGVPPGTIVDPFMKAVLSGPWGPAVEKSRVELHGWITAAGVWGNAKHSNTPDAYWIVPNSYQLDQLIFKLERELDTVQTDHIDFGFRSVSMYGMDYRYTTAGGWFSDQLLRHNSLYGYDPVEQYFEIYIPRIWQGMVIRVGRWIACPDIETQYAPDNYMGSHSLLFTFDTYTQTGAMFSFQMTRRLMLQGAITAGTDMAPWYPGATPTLFAGCRWVSEDNNNAFYTCLNNWNNAHFRYFMADGQKSGHDNFNYIVSTYEHRFSKKIHTKTEAYYMWQVDAVVGGSVSVGPVHGFGGGGGIGKFIPGLSKTYGVLNYTPFQLSDRDYFVIRNEWWRDEEGERSGFPTNYSSHTVALSHQFNDVLMIRPEIGFYHSYDHPAFDLGKKNSIIIYGFDLTLRF